MIPLLLALQGAAHEPGLSRVAIERDRIAVTIDVDEFADRFPTRDVDAASLLLSEYTVGATGLSAGGRPCVIGEGQARPFEEDGIRITAPVYCPEGEGDWVYNASWLRGRDPAHRHLVTAFGQPAGVLDPAHTELRLHPGQPPSAWTVAAQFVGLGVLHIAGGFDHLAFVIGLLLVIRRWTDAAMIVSGFTLAHSVTLTLSALGVVSLAPAVVEPLIALSVAWVGVENLWEPPARRRVLLTLAMGLVHGFGFAGALGEIGLPRDHALLALVGFNGGVELGQLAVVVVLLPLLLRLRASAGRAERLLRGGSVGIALLGFGWFAARILGG